MIRQSRFVSSAPATCDRAIQTDGSLTSSFACLLRSPQRKQWASAIRGLLLGMTGAVVWALPSGALPEGGNVSAGQAEIQQNRPNQLNILQTSDRAVINWNSFNIAPSEWVNFQQPSVNSATLNRVTGGLTSDLAGRLTAKGQVILINPNGILFTPTAQINVGSFLGTTLDIQNQDFMQGFLRLRQMPGQPLGTVENEGTITVADSGFAALVAPGVANRGAINARLGTVLLGSGTEATLDFYGDGLFSFAVDPTLSGQVFGVKGQPLDTLVSNSGRISADGGAVRLSAQAGAFIVNSLINIDGVVQARTVENRQGEIALLGSGSGKVVGSGTLDATGQLPGQIGGSVKVLGSEVDLTSNAQLLASGDAGGGSVLVGGDYQGKGSNPAAQKTTVGKDVRIQADALTSGNGGKAIVWADGVTTMNGSISARGGSTAGNGGLVETSGKAGLSIADTASVDVGTTYGTAGTWLLDPDRLFISTASSFETPGASPFISGTLLEPSGGDQSVAANVITDALNRGNVTLAANDLIQVDAAIASSTQPNSNTLAFNDQNADGSLTVNLNAPIQLGTDQTLTGQATIVNVSQPFANILQNGVDVAASGAVLNVASGTFTGTGDQVVNISKNLTVRGQGADSTIVDGEKARRGFNITSSTVNLEDLTIANGSALGRFEGGEDGGGVLIGSASNVTINRTSITNNTAGDAMASFGTGGGIFLDEGNTLTVIDSKILGNSASENGGGISNGGSSSSANGGTLNVIDSTISNNISGIDSIVVYGSGGGIFNGAGGTVTITNSTISNNLADRNGGGISNGLFSPFLGGTVTITNSTISGNSSRNVESDGNGGGIYNYGLLSLTNSTISGNSASLNGGGLYNDDLAQIDFSTISNNSAGNSGGGIFSRYYSSDTVSTVGNSIVAGNLAPTNAEVFNTNTGIFLSNGFNLVGQNGNAGGFPTIGTDIILAGAINTAIAPLADNGGPTLTHALVSGSPAIDAGSSSELTTDQRGASRPQNGKSDIGAFESGSNPSPSPFPSPSPSPTPSPSLSPTPSPSLSPSPSPSSSPSPSANTKETNDSSLVTNSLEDSGIDDTPNQSVQSFPQVPTTAIAKADLAPQSDAPVQELDQFFTASVAGYLGIANAPKDSIDQTKNVLEQIAKVPGVSPSLVYAYFSPAPSNATAAKPTPASILVASTDPFLGLKGSLVSQNSQAQEDKCSSEKPSRPTDPIWQFDSCGWDRIYPKGVSGRDTDQLVLVLITSDGKVVRKKIPNATRGKVIKAVKRFQGSLQGLKSSETYLPQSQQLYRWLVEPLEQDLQSARVNNLVFIMDRGLRSLPMAALHDGKGFIIERYSVGFMPSLSLSDTRYASVKDMRVLAMGASKFADQAPLPSVPLELSNIADRLWAGESFLNEDFTPAQLRRSRSTQPYGIVHLATHGDFQTGKPDQSYIQFWNSKVPLNRLQDLSLTQTDNPVSLLVLSACRTALGDQDAELGFTGLAVSAGVQTALGGLWSISDLGTLAFMTDFYANLKDSPIKAEALRRTQVAMLKGQVRIANGQISTDRLRTPLPQQNQGQVDTNNIDLTHPYYWSGITMVGNPW